MTELTTVDYIIVGGGLSGCALASRLRRSLLNTSILVLEAGQDPDPEHDVVSTFGGFALQGGALDWQFQTAATPSTANRTHTLTHGKTLGGGSVLNYGGWSRGDDPDYDAWAVKLGGDARWCYAGLLPYFKRTESFYDTSANTEKHGFDGPLKITPTKASHAARKYPLRDPIERAWKEVGLQKNIDPFANRLAGLSDYYEIWEDGKRRPSHLAYPLKGVDVRTSTTVSQILFEVDGTPKAIGVKLVNGQTVRAKKETILSAGTLQTPRLLLRSGIGEPSVLSENKIPLVQALPSVGQQYFDHFALFQWFKIKDPSRGLVLGHPNLSDPAFVAGMPGDFSANEGLPRDILEKALDEDGVVGTEREALLQPGRVFVETLIFYHPLAPSFPSDGSILCTSTMLTLPSSRGRVLLSKDIDSTTPHIEPNYFTTALDRVSLIHGVRRLLNVMLGTEALKDYIESELPPPSFTPLTLESSDSEIEDRIRAVGVAHFHAMGSCAMGKVVDGDLRVKGIQSLRICDASVFPSPIGGHPMASLYGVAEQAADIIAASA
ncbi:putative GMC oxidoreductase [Daldinia decipiens]|uniref:putative GMC oxidoreductase n=1 Tax=Daldinia decipiens TaxID=326647 RepID=UPI0020C2462B|nr:putative GMC oxidoreductase [Daldinia decipiens]KAI1659209.1 putative GMC oxidoreductase [Daldinia decipiens]